MPDTETNILVPTCPACGGVADGHRVSHRKFDRATLGPRYSLRYAEPCGCVLDEAQYRDLMLALAPRH